MVSRGAPNRPYRPEHAEFKVNEDPEKLDKVLTRVLGKDGDRLLTDEVKWLAVTHKSFDHGRRGFNDRLAFLGTWPHTAVVGEWAADVRSSTGKRIVELQASLHMIAASATTSEPSIPDQWGREPFKDPVLEGLAGLTMERKMEVLNKKRMGKLASKYGLSTVLRWKPNQVCRCCQRDD